MTRVLVTGANGHLGSNTIRSLLKYNYEIIPFVRKGANLKGLEGLGLNYTFGNILDLDSVISAAINCDVIIHQAAVYSFDCSNPEDIIRPAVVGTENIFKAAQKANIKRIIYTSSIAAIGASEDPNSLLNSEVWNQDYRRPYIIAKRLSEEMAWDLSKKYNIPMIVLCPAMVLGQHDYRITPSMKVILAMLNGKGPTFRGGVNIVDVRDVANVHAKAVENGALGKRYIIGGENIEWKMIGDIITKISGKKVKHVGLGRKPFIILASMIDGGLKLCGKTTDFKDTIHENLERYHYYDCKSTYQTFDYCPRIAKEIIKDSVQWLLSQNKTAPF